MTDQFTNKQTYNSKPTAISEHFLFNNHNASNMLLFPLELVKSIHDNVRKARVACLIHRSGQTVTRYFVDAYWHAEVFQYF